MSSSAKRVRRAFPGAFVRQRKGEGARIIAADGRIIAWGRHPVNAWKKAEAAIPPPATDVGPEHISLPLGRALAAIIKGDE